MNGFKLMADSIRKLASEGKFNPDEANKQARLYDFLSTCDNDDICTLFDSTAFNDIAKGYMRLAIKRLIASGTIDEEQGTAIRNEYAKLFEDKQAKEILEV